MNLPKAFKTFQRVSLRIRFLRLCSSSQDAQIASLYDCFALGRNDASSVYCTTVLLRLLPNDSFRLAIRILSHLTPHPDIFWKSKNWIGKDIKEQVVHHLHWTREEIIWLLSGVPLDQWNRGLLGEDLYMLFIQDPDIGTKMERAAILALDEGDDDVALSALI